MPLAQIKQSKLKTWVASHFKFLAILLVVMILLGGYFFIIHSKIKEFGPGGEFDLTAKKNELIRQDKYLKELSILADSLEEVKKIGLGKLDYILPVNQKLPLIFVQLENIAQESDLLLTNIQISEAIQRKKSTGLKEESEVVVPVGHTLKQLNINLTLAEGSYSDLIKFLENIEANMRLMDVLSIGFSAGSDTYSVNLVTYYLQ